MNTKLVESLVQVILSLSPEERELLESKLFWDMSYPPTLDIAQLAQLVVLLIFWKMNQTCTRKEDEAPVY